MIKDFMEGGVGMDVRAVCVCFVNNLPGDVGEYYEWVIFGEVGDIENGRRDGEFVWV